MAFSSLEFLFRFMPVFFFILFMVRPDYRKYVIFAGSLFFYAYGDPFWVAVMLVSLVLNFIFARKISLDLARETLFGNAEPKLRRLWFVLALVLDIGLIAAFKYRSFMQYELPVGVTFYLMYSAAYIVDLYRGEFVAGGNFCDFAMYVTFFPKIFAGPDFGYRNFKKNQIAANERTLEAEKGLMIFAAGLSYKVLLADNFARIKSAILGMKKLSALPAWLGALTFPVGIYLELFSISLMGMGLAAMCGYKLSMNFNEPFSAKNVTDFCRRFLMTITAWLRKYVYEPLGSSKEIILILAILLGFLQGFKLNYMLFGLALGIILYFEKITHEKIKFQPLMYVLVMLLCLIFTLGDKGGNGLVTYAKALTFTGGGIGISAAKDICLDYVYYIVCGIIACTPLPVLLFKKCHSKIWFKLLLLALLWFAVYRLVIDGSMGFMYFRF